MTSASNVSKDCETKLMAEIKLWHQLFMIGGSWVVECRPHLMLNMV